MNRHHLCLLLLVFLAASLVKSKSTIEVDENGDEYEVKRFHIQGRQLNEGRSQCVEIRRKRAAQLQPQPLYFDNGSNDEIANKDEEDDMATIKGNEGSAMIYYSPPVISSAVVEEHDDQEEGEMNEMNKETLEEMSLIDTNAKNNTKIEKDEEVDDKEKGDDDDTIEVIELPQLPILKKLQSTGEADSSANDEANVASSSANEASVDGIIAIQAYKPPQVNPQTHAIFELVPVESVVTEADYGQESTAANIANTESNVLSSPPATSVWPIGNNPNPAKVKKLTKSKTKGNAGNQKPVEKPQRKNKYNNSANAGLRSGHKNNNENKKRPNKTNAQRPTKTRKTPPGNRNRRPNANKNKPAMQAVPNKNKATRLAAASNRHRYYNNRNRLAANGNKIRKNTPFAANGGNAFTRTYSWTRADDYDDDDDDDYYNDLAVDCIIIRKDPPPSTTTERPFWNFWKRSAGGGRQAADQFGQRKRANLRFVV